MNMSGESSVGGNLCSTLVSLPDHETEQQKINTEGAEVSAWKKESYNVSLYPERWTIKVGNKVNKKLAHYFNNIWYYNNIWTVIV